MNGGTKIWVRVQTASKAEERKAGFLPAPQIEEEEEEEEEGEGVPLKFANE
jgi:hypothetical protein